MALEHWLRKRWSDFRTGSGVYINVFLSIVNTIVLLYGFHIVSGFSNIALFGIVVLIIYIPLSILIGQWHRYKQYKVDNTLLFEGNPVNALIMLQFVNSLPDSDINRLIRVYLQKIIINHTGLLKEIGLLKI